MFVSLFYNCGWIDFRVDKLIPKVTRPLYECLKILNKRPELHGEQICKESLQFQINSFIDNHYKDGHKLDTAGVLCGRGQQSMMRHTQNIL